MVTEDAKKAAELYGLLVEAKEAIVCLLTIGADITYQQAAQYIREGRVFWRNGEHGNARSNFGWAGRWQKMAKAESHVSDLNFEFVRPIRA